MLFMLLKIFRVIKLCLFDCVIANQGSDTTSTAAPWWPLGVMINVKLSRPLSDFGGLSREGLQTSLVRCLASTHYYCGKAI